MNKRMLCFLLALCLVCMTGCQQGLETSALPVQTLPPAQVKHTAPVGDALERNATVALYLPSRDGQRLLTEYITLPLNDGKANAQAIVQALLDHPGTKDAAPLHQQVALSLFGAQPVEVSGGVCTVNLAATALQLDHAALYRVCAAMTATLCELDDVHYVNYLVADQAVSMDITGSLPLGSQTARPGEELTVLWEQMEARRAPLGEDPADTPVTAAATLYFPLADGSGMVAETRNLTFAGQSADQLAEGLVNALSAGAQYVSGTADMPDLLTLLRDLPRTTELEDGGRMVTVTFQPGLEETLRQAGIDMPCLISALTYTLTGFIPSVSSLRMFIGETPLTSLYSAAHGNLIFQNGRILRQQFAPYLMEQVTLYFASGDKLKEVRRAVPHQQAFSPRTLMTQLMAGPTRQELDQGLEPVLPEGLTEADVLGIAMAGDTLLLNLSGRAGEMIRTQASGWEQAVCYGLVNTLGNALGVRRVRFFFDGQMVEELGGTLYWGGEFLVNPSLIDQPLG